MMSPDHPVIVAIFQTKSKNGGGNCWWNESVLRGIAKVSKPHPLGTTVI